MRSQSYLLLLPLTLILFSDDIILEVNGERVKYALVEVVEAIRRVRPDSREM